jgi:hypothetical protein
LAFSRPFYRARQFFGYFRPRLRGEELVEAASVLGEGLWPLFESMSERDQRHSLDVLAVLRDRGCRDQHLLMAALLHDAGKGRLAGVRVRLWHRVAYVLLSVGTPWVVRRLATGRGGIAALHGHAERGAVVAEALGAPLAVVDLIRRHDDPAADDERFLMLRAADDSG